MMEQKENQYALGTYAQRFILIVLPFLLLQLVTLAVYLMPLEGGELLRHEETIRLLFDNIARGFAFFAMGVLLIGYWEKKG